MTAIQDELAETIDEANDVACLLAEIGKTDRAAGLAVSVDLGVSAAFLFTTSDDAFRNAINVVREAISHATRLED